jgi:Chemotaxis phosphatase CheX
VNRVDAADWLDDLTAEFGALASGTLGLDGLEVLARRDAPPPGIEGAYLALVGPSGAYQIGVAAEARGCDALARGLLACGPAEPLAQGDVADAVCEIVNILAGGVKRRVAERSGEQLGLGLPTFFHGAAEPSSRLGVTAAEVRVGDVAAALLVLHPRHAGAEESR